MADNNTSTPSNPFQGATFNTNAINALGSKANQALPNLNGLAGVLPYKKPDTWTPLGSWDAANAGINQTVGGISSVKYVGAIEKLSGGLGMTNDAIAVGQHLLAGRFDAAAVEFVGVGGQGVGTAVGYQAGKWVAETGFKLAGSNPWGLMLVVYKIWDMRASVKVAGVAKTITAAVAVLSPACRCTKAPAICSPPPCVA